MQKVSRGWRQIPSWSTWWSETACYYEKRSLGGGEKSVVPCRATLIGYQCCFNTLTELGVSSCGCALDYLKVLLTSVRYGAAGEHYEWWEYSQQMSKLCQVFLCNGTRHVWGPSLVSRAGWVGQFWVFYKHDLSSVHNDFQLIILRTTITYHTHNRF